MSNVTGMASPERVFVIAEAGVNHDGSLAAARELVDVAAEAGADAVKFQTFRAEDLVAADAPMADYQERNLGSRESQADMIRRYELTTDNFREIAAHCDERRIRFLSTPFDLASLEFLVRDLAMPQVKLSSGDITNGPMLLRAARTKRPIILSTGMSTLDEIQEALAVIAWAYTERGGTPTAEGFRAAFESESGRVALAQRVTLLQCTSEYPAPAAEVNLRAMGTLAEAFGLPVGLSDHTLGVAVSVAAVALGATIIEKHFTLDRSRPGPDHCASLEPQDLRRLVSEIRTVEEALGSARKEVTASEAKNRPIARRSLVALRPIRAGEPFTESNLGAKRPGSGVSPMGYWNYLGKIAHRDYRQDEGIEP